MRRNYKAVNHDWPIGEMILVGHLMVERKFVSPCVVEDIRMYVYYTFVIKNNRDEHTRGKPTLSRSGAQEQEQEHEQEQEWNKNMNKNSMRFVFVHV